MGPTNMGVCCTTEGQLRSCELTEKSTAYHEGAHGLAEFFLWKHVRNDRLYGHDGAPHNEA